MTLLNQPSNNVVQRCIYVVCLLGSWSGHISRTNSSMIEHFLMTSPSFWGRGGRSDVLLPTGSEERGVLGVGSIPVAILPSCQILKTIALYLYINIVG